MQSKKHKRTLYILFAVNIAIFIPYLFSGHAPFSFSSDFYYQYQAFTLAIGRYWMVFFRTGVFPLWDKSLLFGADAIGSMAYYGFGDIWTYVTLALTPVFSFGRALTLVFIAKLTLGSFAAYLFFIQVKTSEKTASYMALLYDCSFWVIALMGYPNHVNYLLYAPLFLLLANEMSEKSGNFPIKMILLLTVSLSNNLAYSFSFSVLTFIYLVIRRVLVQKQEINSVNVFAWLFQWTFLNLFAVFLASPIVWPQLLLLMQSARGAGFVGFSNPLSYFFETLLNMITPQFWVIQGFTVWYGFHISAFATFMGIPLVLYGVMRAKSLRINDEWKVGCIFGVILLAFLFIEPLNIFLNLFMGNYQRWTIMLVLIELALAGLALDYLKQNLADIKWLVALMASVTLLGIVVFVVFQSSSYPWFIEAKETIVSFSLVLCVVLLFATLRKSRNLLHYLCIINLIVSFGLFSSYLNLSDSSNLYDARHTALEVSSWEVNRGVVYGGASQQYYNSFIVRDIANRVTMLEYSREIEGLLVSNPTGHVSLARDFSTSIQYLVGAKYVERVSLNGGEFCVNSTTCLYPTNNTQPRGVVLNRNATMGLDDFKQLNLVSKYKALTSVLLGDKTTTAFTPVDAIEANSFWTEVDGWYSHDFREGEEFPTIFATSLVNFCLNRVGQDCSLVVEASFLDTRIDGINNVSIASSEVRLSKAEVSEAHIPVISVFPSQPALDGKTVEYEWLDSNRFVIHMEAVTKDDVVMLPITFDKSFKIVGQSGAQLEEVQLGMLGVTNIEGTMDVVVQYAPPYINHDLTYILVAFFLLKLMFHCYDTLTV